MIFLMQNYVRRDFNSKYKSLNARGATCWKSVVAPLKNLNMALCGLNGVLTVGAALQESDDILFLGHSELLPYR